METMFVLAAGGSCQTIQRNTESVMSMTNKSKHTLALALGLALAGSAGAAPLYITNASFEDPVLADGVETAPYSVPGWVEYEPSHALAMGSLQSLQRDHSGRGAYGPERRHDPRL